MYLRFLIACIWEQVGTVRHKQNPGVGGGTGVGRASRELIIAESDV